MTKRFLLSLLALASTLQAVQIPLENYVPPHKVVKAPWFTGPLLAPSALTIPPSHYNIEPYIYAIANTGRYNSNWETVKTETFWNNYFQPVIQFGINKWLDVLFSPTLFYNYTHHAGKWDLGDLPVGIDIQLYQKIGKVTDWNMGLKLGIKEIIPIGRYQNLDPKKLLTDVGGEGSWQTTFNLVWGNVFHLGGNRFLTWRNSLLYTLPAPVSVKNLNAYGGGNGTRGTVYPAQNIQLDIAFEVNLNRNWAFAIDFLGIWNGKTRFKGKTLVSNSSPAGEQYSIAPAIEYNWNANLGIIFGPWLTVAGRNSIQFSSGVFAFNYYH